MIRRTILIFLAATVVSAHAGSALAQIACPVPTLPTTPLIVSPFTGTPPQGGTPIDCTTPPPVINGICGATSGACSAGTPTPVDGSGTWTCVGSGGGTTAVCTAPPPTPVNGVCGAADGVATSTIPTTNLCTTGLPTAVSGTGPWSWTCLGSNGGTDSRTCVAPLATVQTTETMGETTVFPTLDNGNGGLLLAQDATLAQAGTLQTLSFYVLTAAGNMRLGLYDVSGNIIVQTASFAPVVGWNTVPVGHVQLAAGTYWLAYEPSSNMLAFPVNRQTGLTCRIVDFGTYRAMPAVFPSFRTDQCHWSLYATLSVP